MNQRLLVVLLSALIAVAATIVAPAAAPLVAAASSPGPLPECRYADVLTPRRAYRDWDKTLLDTILMVPRSYVPPNLVSVSNANIGGSGKVRQLVIADLRALARAARQAGNPLAVRSAYRSCSSQAAIYSSEVRRLGEKKARLQSARPGHSEHQLGTTIDFMAAGGSAPWTGSGFHNTAAGKWLAKNGWRYGFVMSYPPNKRAVTCYMYESWHWRYVGRDNAAAIRASGLTVREWLWRKGYGKG
jgi:zinc D-Ala-D-Ala carboxypeptidase